MSVPLLNVYSHRYRSSQKSTGLSSIHRKDPVEAIRTHTLNQYLKSQHELLSTRNSEKFLQTAYENTYQRMPFTMSMGTFRNKNGCQCNIQKMEIQKTAFQPSMTGNRFYEQSLLRLKAYEKARYLPEKAPYKQYQPSKDELCDHYQHNQYLHLRAQQQENMYRTLDSVQEQRKMALSRKHDIPDAISPPKLNIVQKSKQTQRILDLIKSKKTTQPQIQLIDTPIKQLQPDSQVTKSLELLEQFHDQEIVNAAKGVIRHYNIAIEDKAQLETVLKMMAEAAKTCKNKEEKQTTIMNQLREWHETKTVKTVVNQISPLPSDRQTKHNQKIQKAMGQLDQFQKSIEQKLTVPTKQVKLSDLVRLRYESDTIGRQFMSDLDQLINRTTSPTNILEDLTYFQ